MRRFLLVFLLMVFIVFPSTGFAYTFSDDFNDPGITGWTPKQGDWSNPGGYLQSSYDNYGIIWKDDSLGFDQYLQVDAYFPAYSTHSKSASLRLRSGVASSGNPYWDHGYLALVQDNYLCIQNNVAGGFQQLLGSAVVALEEDNWYTIAFSVTGSGNDTHLQLWLNNVLMLDVYDTLGSQHDDGGYVGLGSSNHINRRINYDNAEGYVDEVPVPEPATMLLLGTGFVGLVGVRRKKK